MNNLIKLDHIITYNDEDLARKFNITDEKDKEQLLDVIYKYDLIRIFDLNDFLEEIIDEKINKLYSIMISNVDIQKICSCIEKNIYKEKNNNENKIETFMILFSYDYLYLFYPCICEFIIKGSISSEKINLITQKK
jgi:hypothetical protein